MPIKDGVITSFEICIQLNLIIIICLYLNLGKVHIFMTFAWSNCKTGSEFRI